MRYRSKTNSRKWEDLRFRADYLDQNRERDELLHLFPNYGAEAIVQIGNVVHSMSLRYTQGLEPHHIAGGANGARRWDVATNLVAVSNTVHRWCEKYRPEGMVLCISVKMDKGEWDEEFFTQTIMGLTRPGASVLEYIRIREPMHFEWVQEIFEGLFRKGK